MPAGSYKCVTDSITNYCGADFQSCKKPGFSNSMMNSSSRMSISSTSRSNLARPINAKSESCLQHKRGHCNDGADCIFSHDMPEDQYRLMNRARLCRFFMNGKNCPYGNRCHFLQQSVKHVKGGSGVAREKAAVTVVNSGPEEGVRKESDRLACKRKAVLWKTRPCNNWDRNGSCPYGVRCQYAHGERGDNKIIRLTYSHNFARNDMILVYLLIISSCLLCTVSCFFWRTSYSLVINCKQLATST